MSSQQEIIDNLKIVCQCNGIRKATYKKLIKEGVVDVAGLKKATGAGSGDCAGRRCIPRLEELIEKSTTPQ